MKFLEIPLQDARVIEPEPLYDSRGFFARVFSEALFEEQGLESHFVQCNLSLSTQEGTLRGMHFQVPPYGEDKLVRCIRGAIFDQIVDIRPESPTYLQAFGVELTAENRKMLFVPKGFAHGFQTLTDDAEVFYQISQYFVPEAQSGIRWNDPALGLSWPMPPKVLSDRDRSFPDFQPLRPLEVGTML